MKNQITSQRARGLRVATLLFISSVIPNLKSDDAEPEPPKGQKPSSELPKPPPSKSFQRKPTDFKIPKNKLEAVASELSTKPTIPMPVRRLKVAV